MDFRKLRLKSDADWEDPFEDSKPKVKLEDNQIESNGKIITLNDVQFQALKAGREFLSSDRSFFCLSGSAGTGKTTVSKAILNNRRDVVVTAPTHKAKKVVSRCTGYRGETIQKILGMRPEVTLEGFSSDNVLFAMSGKNLLSDYSVVLIDESSMLNKDMVDLLLKCARENEVKILFMGDKRQLPPVGESISQVFIHPEIEQFSLVKVERQKIGNPAIELFNGILDHIDKVDIATLELQNHNRGVSTSSRIDEIEKILNTVPYDLVSHILEDGTGYKFFDSKAEFGSMIMNSFKLGEDLNNRVIAWTNQCVQGYNRAIRRRLIGDADLPLQEGEFLMAYESVTDQENWSHIIYENSADYIVRKVEPGYKQAATYEDTKTKKFSNIEGWFVTIEDVDNDRGVEKVFVVSRESYKEYVRIEHTYKKFADESKNNKKWAWSEYYKFRRQFCVFPDVREFYKDLVKDVKKVKIDFDFGYAITVHKSQGSTYNNVFVVQEDIFTNANAQERWRLMYVALSRLSNAAYIL